MACGTATRIASNSSRVELLVGLEEISEPDKHGMRTVMCILNGQLRPAQVRDLSLDVTESLAEKAIPGNPKHIAAPLGGVVTIVVEPRATLAPGASIGSLEAMKMEAAIPAPAGGTVQRVAISSIASVEGGDLLIELQ